MSSSVGYDIINPMRNHHDERIVNRGANRVGSSSVNYNIITGLPNLVNVRRNAITPEDAALILHRFAPHFDDSSDSE